MCKHSCVENHSRPFLGMIYEIKRASVVCVRVISTCCPMSTLLLLANLTIHGPGQSQSQSRKLVLSVCCCFSLSVSLSLMKPVLCKPTETVTGQHNNFNSTPSHCQFGCVNSHTHTTRQTQHKACVSGQGKWRRVVVYGWIKAENRDKWGWRVE